MTGSLYYSIAKWLSNKTDPICVRLAKYSLQDTFELVDNGFVNKLIISLDVKSLFTNVPQVES